MSPISEIDGVFARYQLWLGRSWVRKSFEKSIETVERHKPRVNPTHETSATEELEICFEAVKRHNPRPTEPTKKSA